MKHLKPIFAAVALALFAIAGPAAVMAHGDDDTAWIDVDENTDTSNPNIKHFKYDYYAGPEYFADYDLVRKAMDPVFAGTFVDYRRPDASNPMLGITQFDLNNDGIPEIIAFPIQEEEHGNIFCGGGFICPHYVIDVSGKDPKVLGVVKGFAVDRGEDVKNGYWTLKAFTKQNEPENFGYSENYVFNKKAGAYQLVPHAPAKKPSP